MRQVDVTHRESVEAATAAVVDRWGRIDVLVNNAGIVRDAQLVKWKDGEVASVMDDAAFDAVIAVNFKGVFLCARTVVPHMIRGGGGVILNASSVVGLYGNFGQTNYAATKSAVITMTRTWARELGKYGIRVNAVAPGFVATEILAAMPQKVLDGMIAHTPIGRIGSPRSSPRATSGWPPTPRRSCTARCSRSTAVWSPAPEAQEPGQSDLAVRARGAGGARPALGELPRWAPAGLVAGASRGSRDRQHRRWRTSARHRRALGTRGFTPRPRRRRRPPGALLAGKGPTLLFLHGLGDQAGSWGKVASPLAGRYRVILADLPGHGESEPRTGPLTMATIVAGAERIFAEVSGDGPVIVVGNSLGAWVATLLAERHPQQVARLVLVNGGALRGQEEGLTLQPRNRREAASLVARLRDPSAPPVPGFVLDDIVRQAASGTDRPARRRPPGTRSAPARRPPPGISPRRSTCSGARRTAWCRSPTPSGCGAPFPLPV